MPSEKLINELEHYRFNLKEIMGRFVHSRNSYTIRREDDPQFRTFVIEIIDLLNDSIGKNKYSSLINQIFNEGLFPSQSPSHKSIEDIVSVLDSVITRIKRNPELCNPKKDDMPIEIKPIEYPEKITLKWLYTHVPYRFWSYLLGLLLAAFILGTTFANTQLYKSFIALITPNANITNKNPQNAK